MNRTLLVVLFLVASANRWAMGQSAGEASTLREQTQDILRMQNDARRTDLADDQWRARMRNALDRRENMLRELIQKNPAEALATALPEEVLAELKTGLGKDAGKLETRGTWLGTVEQLIEDDETLTSHKTYRRLRVGNERFDLHFAGEEPQGIETGKIMAVTGLRVGNQIAAMPDQVTMSAAASVGCSTTGQQNVLAILANLPSYKLGSNSVELVKGIMLGNSFSSDQATPNISVDDFWQQASDGRTWVTKTGTGALTVLGPVELSSDFRTGGPSNDPDCNTEGLRSAAIAAIDSQVNLQNYSRIMIVFPNQGGCGFAGLAYVGCPSWSSASDGSYTAGVAWLRADTMGNRDMGVKLVTHELGHSLGMSHASTRDFGAEPLGPVGNAGSMNEYGDVFSTMGSWNLGFYAAPHAAQRLNWLVSGAGFLDVSTSGTYTIQAVETRPGGTKALRVRRGTNNAWLWIEFRRGVGLYNSTLAPQVFSGALIHYEDSFIGNKSHLLDFTTNTDSFSDPALPVGATWTDPYSNLSIKVDSISNDLMTVTVNYSGTTSCTRANPQVTLSPNPAAATAGTAVSFTVSVRNNDSSSCSSSTFQLTSTQPSGWTSSFSASSISVAPGATWTSTYTTTPASTASGAFTVGVSAASSTGNGSGSATVNVSAPVVSPLSGAIASDSTSYKLRAWATFTTTVMRGTTPVAGASVSFTMNKPNGNATALGTTGRDGKVTWRYRLTTTDPVGTYTVSSSINQSGQTAAAGPISVSVVR